MNEEKELLEEVYQECMAMEDQCSGYYDDVTNPDLRMYLREAADALRSAWKEAQRLSDE